jgi:hypothetical protein
LHDQGQSLKAKGNIMENYMTPFILRDAVLFVTFLFGAIAGVYLLTQNQTKVGGLILAAFVILELEPLTDFLIFNFLTPNFGGDTNYVIFNWSYACISGISIPVGVSALLAAVYFAIKPKQEEAVTTDQAIFMPEDSTK